MRSKDTEFAASKLSRCLRAGGAKVEWGKHVSVRFDETVAPSTRELNTTPDDPGFMQLHLQKSARHLSHNDMAGCSIFTDSTNTASIRTAQNTCIKRTNSSRRNYRSRSRSLYGHSSHDTQKGSSQKRRVTHSNSHHQNHGPQKQREKANKQEPPPPPETFAAPEVRRLPPREPLAGAPVSVPPPRESSPEPERGSARLCTDR